MNNFIFRELQYITLTIMFLLIGLIPFEKGYFSTEKPKNVTNAKFSTNEELINDEEIIQQYSFMRHSGLIDLHDDLQDNHSVKNSTFYAIFTLLFIFIIFPVRYTIYLLNYLLDDKPQ
ncbi:hypothetical protein [Flammeovirga agarivorans]|uniref:Uncharacterized protein n=1 Tax=Flammeovirga agarivorans TaxID=2726742 RepID=A0A7X8SHU2_9BACT|nr:hypothetical protein [Flammeovirga agarivorans]NLR90464.1 hypothetical protein [Flammeovirga agarivorans]